MYAGAQELGRSLEISCPALWRRSSRIELINRTSAPLSYRIHVAGNFRIVQNFAVFADSSAAAEIRTTNFSSLSSANYGLSVGVVSLER